MSTKILVPRGSGEGGIGHHDNAWGQAYFDSGHFSKELYLSGQSIGAIVSQGGLGGKWDDATTPGDIYYTGGNVGIGTTNPSVALEVLDSENNAYAAKIVNIGGDGYGALIKTAAGASENYPILDLENTSSNVFRVEAKGNVGIGTTNPAQKLDVYGNIAVNGTIVHTSDDRVKHNEQPIVGAVETLGKITPKKYIKTNEMYDVDHDFQLDADGNPIDENGESVEHRIEAGVIAQQVLTVDELAFAVTPEGVDEDGDATRPHGLDYNSLFTYAIAAIQEQQEIIENLKSRIETLEK